MIPISVLLIWQIVTCIWTEPEEPALTVAEDDVDRVELQLPPTMAAAPVTSYNRSPANIGAHESQDALFFSGERFEFAEPDVPDDDKLSCSLGFRFDPHARTVLPRLRTVEPPPCAVNRLCPALVMEVPQFTKYAQAAD